ncbi:response regulator [Caenimonas sedimenti]|uniref:response regulator n=1 Tax=Caenimonas sedimenti TaxID=2596921 RepID=UPI0021057A29|nr:response regulator transcription factor [Caenimonas sedimenti]
MVDDNAFHREHLCAAVTASPELRLVGAADDAASALVLMQQQCVDVLLVDLGLPDRSGLEVIRHVRAHCPATDVMVVTVFTDERHVLQSLEAGATGYLLKDATAQEIRQAVLEIVAGGSPISPLMARHLLKRFRPAPVPEAPLAKAVLSTREIEVLQVVAKGLSVKEAADILALSPMTVGTHVKNIYRKLAVNSRAEAVYEAGRLGLLAL